MRDGRDGPSPPVRGAHDEVVALQAPIVHALRGKEHVEWDYSYDVGMTGLIGFASGCHAMEACDALLMLGTDFPYRQFSPKGAQIAQVDLRAEVLGRRAPIALGLPGDVKAMVEALLPRLAGGRAGPLRPDPGRARRARLRPGGGAPAPAARGARAERAGGRGRRVHGRRRPADGVGRATSR